MGAGRFEGANQTGHARKGKLTSTECFELSASDRLAHDPRKTLHRVPSLACGGQHQSTAVRSRTALGVRSRTLSWASLPGGPVGDEKSRHAIHFPQIPWRERGAWLDHCRGPDTPVAPVIGYGQHRIYRPDICSRAPRRDTRAAVRVP